MKRFKIIDMWISVALIVSCTIYLLIEMDIERLIMGYFLVGGWQVISMIVHAVTGTFTYKGGVRLIYHWITFISLVTIPLGSFWILAFTAPFMAVLYTAICFREVKVKMRRPLSLLK